MQVSEKFKRELLFLIPNSESNLTEWWLSFSPFLALFKLSEMNPTSWRIKYRRLVREYEAHCSELVTRANSNENSDK